MFNRRALKIRAKSLINEVTPKAWVVTLAYLMATFLVSQIVGNVLTVLDINPIQAATTTYDNWLLDAEEAILATGTVSDASMTILFQKIIGCFTGTGAMIGLLLILLVFFYSVVVDLGFYGYTVRTMRGEEAGIRELFSNFDIATKAILLRVLKMALIFLWSMLFLVPGIVAAYRYRMAEYCLYDDPEISPFEALKRSKKMMIGHKMELLSLDFSFIGWYFLVMVIVNLVYNGVYLFAGDYPSEIAYAVVYLVTGMFFNAYLYLTYGGYYLYLLEAKAPPVNMGRGENPSENHPDNSWM